MANSLKDTPIYADRLSAWYGQRITWALYGSLALCVVLGGIDLKHAFAPPQPPYVLKVNDHGEPVGQVLPIRSVQAVPDAMLKAQLADFIHAAFSIERDGDEENRVFSMTETLATGQAAEAIQTWYKRDNNKHYPTLVWKDTWAEATPTDVLKLDGNDRYLVNYTVCTKTNNGQTTTCSNWRALLHLIVARSSDPESLGWYVNYIDFSEVK